MEQKPSVGRIVHYQSYGTPGGEHPSVPRAAIITAVRTDGTAPDEAGFVDICIVNPTGLFFDRGVAYNADGKPGTWRWPPRV